MYVIIGENYMLHTEENNKNKGTERKLIIFLGQLSAR